jgi:threonyl-tRNA synthetase
MLVIGKQEVETRTVTPRFRDGQNLTPMTIDQFSEQIEKDVRSFH